MEKEKIAFVAPKKVTKKIQELQQQLKLDSPGEVIAMALSMLELAIGRNVEYKDGSKKLKISKFSKYNQTVVVDDGEQK